MRRLFDFLRELLKRPEPPGPRWRITGVWRPPGAKAPISVVAWHDPDDEPTGPILHRYLDAMQFNAAQFCATQGLGDDPGPGRWWLHEVLDQRLGMYRTVREWSGAAPKREEKPGS